MKYLRITTTTQSLIVLLDQQPEFLHSKGFEVHLCSSGEQPKELKEFAFHSLPLTRTINIVQDIKSILKLRDILKYEKFDLIHSHTPKAGLISMIAGFLARSPNKIHTVAGLPQDDSSLAVRFILHISEFLTYLLADRVYFNSMNQMNNQKKIFRLFAHNFSVIHNGTSNGIDLKKFNIKFNKVELRAKLNLDADKFYWVYIGRIHRHKGIIELIDAFKSFNDDFQNQSELLIIGRIDDARNDLTEEWKKEVEKSCKNIKFVGYQKNVEEWLEASDVLIFPSYREGFPNVPLQAAVMGLPVLATDINGCNEIVSHFKNGFLFPKKNSEIIKNFMIVLFESPTLRKNMSEWSRKFLPGRYDRAIFQEKLLNEYLTILDNGKS